MGNLLLCANAIAPLLILMLLGYALKRIGFISREGFAAIDKLCFKILIPAMLFSNVYSADFSRDFHPGAVLYMEIAILAVFLAAFFLAPRLMRGSREDRATVVHAVCHGNLAVLGLPLIMNLFGPEKMAVYSILLACTSPLINPLMVFEHVYFQGGRLRPWRLARDVLSSPFLIGTLLGLGCMALGIRFPAFLQTSIDNLKSIASPLCLIALGGSFSFSADKTNLKYVLGSVLTKCVLVPAVVLSVAVLLGFRGIVLASLMVIFACPSATATYSFCTGYCGNPPLASQIVVCSTLFSIFSMFGWLFAFLQLGLFF